MMGIKRNFTTGLCPGDNNTTKRKSTLADDGLLDLVRVASTVADRDSQLDNPFSEVAQVNNLPTARKILGAKIVRTIDK
ncbi:hypothetical protein [Escherichia coli]|uniref:hypothetical protein n=1 Tax=Escherichia coli TaxID=562 RepID=UPI00192142AC|nr:hypothetical protein [Escherichia coli]